jgi:hypothetical protein
MSEHLTDIEYWTIGPPWAERYLIHVTFGGRTFAAPFGDDAIEPWDHWPTFAEVVREVAKLATLLQEERAKQ